MQQGRRETRREINKNSGRWRVKAATRCQTQRCIHMRIRRHEKVDVHRPNWPIPNHFKKRQSVNDGVY
jgi:hypothetical protein